MLTLTLSERNALLWRPVNYNLAVFQRKVTTLTVTETANNNLAK